MNNISKTFMERARRSTQLEQVIHTYKNLASENGGYLNTPIFKAMKDGADEVGVRRFFAGPFAEVRTWLPEMFGIFLSRFPDHPHSYVVADNLADEYGKYFGKDEIEPSHALLYRRVLDALNVRTKKGTMTTPLKASSKAAADFRKWFKQIVETKSPEYLLGHFLAYEITDVLDFPHYTVAAKRIWKGDADMHEFFTQHADSGHDSAFAKDLQPLFEKNRKAVLEAMGELLEEWTRFYQKASEEIAVR